MDMTTQYVQHNSKESELARFIEIEQQDLTKDEYFDYDEIQRHFENLVNEQDELEKEDENYIDNEYPDDDEVSDNDRNYYHADDEYNDQYDMFDQTDNYDPNALGLDFFTSYNFN